MKVNKFCSWDGSFSLDKNRHTAIVLAEMPDEGATFIKIRLRKIFEDFYDVNLIGGKAVCTQCSIVQREMHIIYTKHDFYFICFICKEEFWE